MNSRTASIVSYITWIGLIIAIIFGDKNDEFFKHHLNQAFGIWVTGAVVGLIGKVLGFIPIIRVLAGIAASIIGIVLFIFAIAGIISAANDDVRPLPVFGSVKVFR